MGKFDWFGLADALALFRKRGEAARGNVRDVCARAQEHLAALAGLFALELGQYMKVQAVRAALCLAAGFALCVAYLALWCLVVALLAPLTGLGWAVGICCAANLLTAVVLFLIAAGINPGAMAPDTVKEVKTDWQCLQLLLQQDTEKTSS